jgi:hypoxanthine phosphoribosyltransferase
MEPDFYAVEVPQEKWAWFIFPWNLNEDLRTLLPKTLYEPKTKDEIKRAFKDQFKINVPQDHIKTTLKDLAAMGKVKKVGKKWAKAE